MPGKGETLHFGIRILKLQLNVILRYVFLSEKYIDGLSMTSSYLFIGVTLKMLLKR